MVNREFTLWDLKYYIIPALAFTLAQSFLIFRLVTQNRRRRSAEESLQKKRRNWIDSLASLWIDRDRGTQAAISAVEPGLGKGSGYSREELMTTPFFDIVAPGPFGQPPERPYPKPASQQEIVHSENRYAVKRQLSLPEWTSAPAGELIYAAARKMTERVEAEAEARQRRKLAHPARVAMMEESTASLSTDQPTPERDHEQRPGAK